jgi:hypothetical protein
MIQVKLPHDHGYWIHPRQSRYDQDNVLQRDVTEVNQLPALIEILVEAEMHQSSWRPSRKHSPKTGDVIHAKLSFGHLGNHRVVSRPFMPELERVFIDIRTASQQAVLYDLSCRGC